MAKLQSISLVSDGVSLTQDEAPFKVNSRKAIMPFTSNNTGPLRLSESVSRGWIGEADTALASSARTDARKAG